MTLEHWPELIVGNQREEHSLQQQQYDCVLTEVSSVNYLQN